MLKECRSRLDHFQKKIEVLRKDDGSDGVWQDFTPENSRAVNALNAAEVKNSVSRSVTYVSYFSERKGDGRDAEKYQKFAYGFFSENRL